MKRYSSSLFGTLLLSFLILTMAGCGAKMVKATGKIVQSGKPMQLSDKGEFVVAFYAESDKEGNRPLATSTTRDGTFTVNGAEGKGIPTGKYRVSVKAMDPYDKGQDKLGGKFAGAKSPLVVEVGSGEVILEVGK